MDIFAFVIIGAVGFVLGLYISSQITEHIDSITRHKEFLKNLEKFDNEQGTRKKNA